MPAQPTISIIIPVYAVEEHVGACLDSILRQAPANTEVIAVDDCPWRRALRAGRISAACMRTSRGTGHPATGIRPVSVE